MHRYGWLVVAGVGWAILVGAATFVYARWAFARRGWTPGGVEARSSRHRPRVRGRLRRRSIRVRVAAERAVPLVELVDTAQAAQPARPVRAARPAATPVPEPAAPPQRVEPAPVAAAPAAQRVAPPRARPVVNNARPAPSAGRAGRPSTLALLQRLSDADPVRRMTALREATGLPDADRIMIRALSDEYPMVRREAVRILGEMATQEATKALTDVAAHDTSSEVREEAIAALAGVIRRRKGSSSGDSAG